ncbi:MAG: DUF4358 domain-containing protein [Oscillospiraceae bacterium]
MKKRGLAVILAVSLTLLAASGCSSKETKTLDLTAFGAKVLETVRYDDELVKMSEKVIPDYYNLSFDGLKESVIYASGTMATANELAVFCVADEKAMEAAKQAVAARIKDQTANYQNYNPAELSRIEKALIVSEGHYLLFSISNDNDAIQKLFEESLK